MRPEVARQRGIVERREGHDLRARVLEQLEILRIVEAERVVIGDADAHRRNVLRRGCAAQRRGVHHARPSHEPFDEVEVAMPGDRVTELGDGLVDVRVLQQREQPGAQLGDVHRLDVGQRAEHRHPGERPHRILDDAAPVIVGNVVEDHADDACRAVELLDAERGRGGCLAHRPGVDHQHDRRPDGAGNLERAPREFRRTPCRRVGAHPMAVEHTHRTFDDHPIGTQRTVRQGAPHSVATEQPGIEVATRPAARMGEVGGIDEVGADLECLHRAPASAECGGEAEADRGLPGTRTQAADHEPRNPDLVEHEVPPHGPSRTARLRAP